MKGWSLIELREDVEGNTFRFTAPAGAKADVMIGIMKDWIDAIEKLAAESEEKKELDEAQGESPSDNPEETEQE